MDGVQPLSLLELLGVIWIAAWLWIVKEKTDSKEGSSIGIENSSDQLMNLTRIKILICLLSKNFIFNCFMWFCYILVIYDWFKLAA